VLIPTFCYWGGLGINALNGRLSTSPETVWLVRAKRKNPFKLFSRSIGKLIPTRARSIFDRRYSVRWGNAERVSVVTNTQSEAIDRVREHNPGHRPEVERIRNTAKGKARQVAKAMKREIPNQCFSTRSKLAKQLARIAFSQTDLKRHFPVLSLFGKIFLLLLSASAVFSSVAMTYDKFVSPSGSFCCCIWVFRV
jgi:hypothetical protein